MQNSVEAQQQIDFLNFEQMQMLRTFNTIMQNESSTNSMSGSW